MSFKFEQQLVKLGQME